MENILNLIICCRSEEIPKKSDINIQTEYSTNIRNSSVNNKLVEKEKDKSNKSSEIKNEFFNLKSTESNLINDTIIEINNKNISNIINKPKETKKEKINNSNKNSDTKEIQRSNKKSRSKRDSKSKKNSIKSNKDKKDIMAIEEENKISQNKSNYRSSHGKVSKSPPLHKDSVLTLNDLVLHIKAPEEKYENGSKLLVTGELFFDKEIIVHTNGLRNSMRKQKDEHVYFGIKCKSNASNCFAYNDIIINYFYSIEDEETIETETGRVFEIYYNKSSKDYSLNFIHPNLILYYKINNFVYFHTGKEYYLLLGNVFMTINVIKNSPIEKTILIQIEIENNKPKSYSFNQSQTPIKIGRTNNNELPIFNQSISKRHGLIDFSNNLQNFYYRDMGSTNSSTLLVKEGDDLKIKGIMNFKLEDTPFRIQEIP